LIAGGLVPQEGFEPRSAREYASVLVARDLAIFAAIELQRSSGLLEGFPTMRPARFSIPPSDCSKDFAISQNVLASSKYPSRTTESELF
jgi:hypothetical protein